MNPLPVPYSGCSIIDIFLSPMVIGVMLEQWLLGIICSQAATYFRYHFSTDSTFCRSIATCLVISTVFLGILDFISLYRSLVWDYGNCEKFDLQDWITYTEPSITAWIAFVAHIFYIFRCWAVTRSLPVCVILGTVALNSLVSGIATTVYGFSAGRMSKLSEIVVPAVIWFTSTGVCDLGISTVLLIYLWPKECVFRTTNAMISRLRRTTLETGLLTTLCAILNVILFATMPDKAFDMLLQYSTSHLYTLSVLYTLLGRHDLRSILNEGSGTFVTDFRTSFLAAGVLSASSLDDCLEGDGSRMRNRTSNIVAIGQSQGGDEV